jgi:hypothetical protein
MEAMQDRADTRDADPWKRKSVGGAIGSVMTIVAAPRLNW